MHAGDCVRIGLIMGMLAWAGCGSSAPSSPQAGHAAQTDQIQPLVRSEAEWRSLLSPEEYRILREKGTEPRFSGVYLNHKEAGVYACRGCELPLYASSTKFDSGTGWPSFWDAVNAAHIRLERDTSHGMVRTELLCARCDSHLGHVFGDGPAPTGLRHCINSLSLKFKPQDPGPDSGSSPAPAPVRP